MNWDKDNTFMSLAESPILDMMNRFLSGITEKGKLTRWQKVRHWVSRHRSLLD
jgi:hypothetical protein